MRRILYVSCGNCSPHGCEPVASEDIRVLTKYDFVRCSCRKTIECFALVVICQSLYLNENEFNNFSVLVDFVVDLIAGLWRRASWSEVQSIRSPSTTSPSSSLMSSTLRRSHIAVPETR